MTPSLFPSLPYGELDAAQKERVAYLFADHLCDSDPLTYRYEINGNKEITGRVATLKEKKYTHPKKITSHVLGAIATPQPTQEQIVRIKEATKQLAHIFVKRMAQIPVEVSV